MLKTLQKILRPKQIGVVGIIGRLFFNMDRNQNLCGVFNDDHDAESTQDDSEVDSSYSEDEHDTDVQDDDSCDDEVDEDCLLAPDHRVFEDDEDEEEDDNIDVDLPCNGLDEKGIECSSNHRFEFALTHLQNTCLRTVLPNHLLDHLDEQFGMHDSSPPTPCNKREKSQRLQRFDEDIRQIIRNAKLIASTSRGGKLKEVFEEQMFTVAFAGLLTRGSEDYLVEQVLSGVPESTKIVLGQRGFQIEDLLSLPRLSNSELSEKYVYLDVLQYAPNESLKWKLYVGSAVSEFGSLRRWHGYLRKTAKGTRHESALKEAGRTMNLQCISHDGFYPELWLPLLTEAVMMIYLGSVNEPRLTQASTSAVDLRKR
ncbi:hypothetical protein IAQ61_006362 [Plenodomus lingam]|uniref:uncharacterized protein n=1 Tax=Leptosphaeria maculans TaxID=5022 RepID=UPI003323A2A9|nr:hypothetical protein IAQ61_006362 [Plenodomus lingam]